MCPPLVKDSEEEYSSADIIECNDTKKSGTNKNKEVHD